MRLTCADVPVRRWYPISRAEATRPSRTADRGKGDRGNGDRGGEGPHHPLFARSSNDRVIAGVAGGLAERLGVDPVVVRLAFVVLALAGGVGVVLYLVLWTIGRSETETRPAWRAGGDGQRTVAIVSVVVGLLLVLRATHVWFGDALVWPVALAAVGSAIIWVRFDRRSRARKNARPTEGASDTSSISFARLAVGGVLVVAGIGVFLASNISSSTVGAVLVALAVAVAGLALIGGPWIARLVRQLGAERTERIRVEEREEVAAHLHDSVLQTLALIQRTEDPGRMRALARVQERDLRGWLYRGDASANGSRDRVTDAVDAVTERIELAHGIRIDTVVVGDRPVDARVQAVIDACGEALTNAAKHSGADVVSLYVEVTDDDVTAFVRDQGAGFDTEAVSPDRRGIADSILGRMARNGGTADIRSVPDEGTEVRLHAPRGDA